MTKRHFRDRKMKDLSFPHHRGGGEETYGSRVPPMYAAALCGSNNLCMLAGYKDLDVRDTTSYLGTYVSESTLRFFKGTGNPWRAQSCCREAGDLQAWCNAWTDSAGKSTAATWKAGEQTTSIHTAM